MAVILDNLLKQSFGGLYVTGGAGTQETNGTPGVYNQITQFTVTGAHSDLIIPDHTTDQIVVYKSGIYLCHYSVTFDPETSDTYYFQVWAGTDGAETARVNITSASKVAAPNDWNNQSGVGFITLLTYDTVILKVACSAASKDVAIKEANLTILRVSGS